MSNAGAFALTVLGIFSIIMLVSWIVHNRGLKLSEFAVGVTRSIIDDPASWDYNHNEYLLISDKAALAISLQDWNFGMVTTRRNVNAGTQLIEQFEGADKRAFRKAVRQWRKLTEIDRRQIADRRKRDALSALGS